MSKNSIVINGQEFPLHYQLLLAIAENIPGEKNYMPLAKAISCLNIPSLTAELIEKEMLPVEDLDAIWDKGDRELRRRLVDNGMFRKNLTDRQAEDIITMDDIEIFKTLADWSEQLYPDSEDEQAIRLSGKMADALLEHMFHHKDASVRRALAENSGTPLKFMPSFGECLKSGYDIRSEILSRMQENDVELLPECPWPVIKDIANYIEYIKNDKVRNKVIDFICAYPDPVVRLELAENFSAPGYAINKLLSDSDPDVVRAAENSHSL